MPLLGEQQAHPESTQHATQFPTDNLNSALVTCPLITPESTSSSNIPFSMLRIQAASLCVATAWLKVAGGGVLGQQQTRGSLPGRHHVERGSPWQVGRQGGHWEGLLEGCTVKVLQSIRRAQTRLQLILVQLKNGQQTQSSPPTISGFLSQHKGFLLLILRIQDLQSRRC
jgi:hypothetical protein